MNNIKLNKIIFITSLISLIFFGISLLIYIHVRWYDTVGNIFKIMTIISSILIVIIGIIFGITIIATNWNNNYLNSTKIRLTFGILSIVPLFTIASLIFSAKVNYVKNNNKVEYVYKNLIQNKNCRTVYEILLHLDELYKKGIIDKKIYNEQKEKILGK